MQKKRIPRTQRGLALPCGDDNAPLGPRAEIRLSTDSETVRNVCPAAKCNHGAWDLGQLRACWGQLTWIMVNARGPDRKGSSGASRDRAYVRKHTRVTDPGVARGVPNIYRWCIFVLEVAGVALGFSKSETAVSWITRIDRLSLKGRLSINCKIRKASI